MVVEGINEGGRIREGRTERGSKELELIVMGGIVEERSKKK